MDTTADERINRIEDALSNLGHIMEQDRGPWALNVNGTIRALGEQFCSWRDEVASERT